MVARLECDLHLHLLTVVTHLQKVIDMRRATLAAAAAVVAALFLGAGTSVPALASDPADPVGADSVQITGVKLIDLAYNGTKTVEITGTVTTVPEGTVPKGDSAVRYRGNCQIEASATDFTNSRGLALGEITVPCGQTNAPWKMTVTDSSRRGWFACGDEIRGVAAVTRTVTAVEGGREILDRSTSNSFEKFFITTAC